jgi:hypothetical protein
VGLALDYTTQKVQPILDDIDFNATIFHVACGLVSGFDAIDPDLGGLQAKTSQGIMFKHVQHKPPGMEKSTIT